MLEILDWSPHLFYTGIKNSQRIINLPFPTFHNYMAFSHCLVLKFNPPEFLVCPTWLKGMFSIFLYYASLGKKSTKIDIYGRLKVLSF